MRRFFPKPIDPLQKDSRWLLSLLAVLVVCAGCTDPQVRRLAGTWELVQAGEVAERINLPAGDRREADTDESQSLMVIRFRTNGTLETQTQINAINTQKQGTWRVLSYTESPPQMAIECVIGLQTTTCDVEFQDDDTLQMVPPNMAGTTRKMAFRRSR